MGREILFTGFPGFISERLVAALWPREGGTYHFLVHPSMVDVAQQKLSQWDPEGKKSVIWVGDLTKPRLGLSSKDHRRLAQKIDTIFHLAALYHLGTRFWPAYSVNVIGTHQVLHLARLASQTVTLHYFSTAYVAGKRKGRVLESELDQGQKFRNHYESTKFLAEVLVRREMEHLPTVIYRPSIVVGDSKTGETAKVDGPYYAIQLLQRLKKQGKLFLAPFFLPQLGTGKADLNLVPVDFVVDSVCALCQDEEALGKTFHLVDPHPISVGEFRQRLFQHYHIQDLPLTLPPESLFLFDFIPQKLWDTIVGVPRQILAYLHSTPQFDTSEIGPFLEKHSLRCPPLPEYLPKMIQFVESHETTAYTSTPEGLKIQTP